MLQSDEVCGFCGLECPPDRKMCEDCWDDVPGELQDRVRSARASDVEARYMNAIEGCIKFLIWRHENS